MIGLAVNVTDVPAQIVVPGFAEIVTEGTKIGFTVIVIFWLDTVEDDGQVAFDVIDTDTTSLFASVVEVNVGLLEPWLDPFTVHW